MKKRTFYWDAASEQIGKILINNIEKSASICEIGFASGHFLEYLYSCGYSNLSGIEIREDVYKKTAERFKLHAVPATLINDNVLNLQKKYDAIFSTGLIQCFAPDTRVQFIMHLSLLSDFAIYVVPEIKTNRNVNSTQNIAVSGCREWTTGNLPYELNNFYSEIRCGRIEKAKTHLEDAFLYYVCKKGT